MDEILLTPDDVKRVVEKVSKETPSFTPPARYLDIQREALCRAQVRKVVEWSEGECKHDSKRIRRCCDLCWRDVKAAGEGK